MPAWLEKLFKRGETSAALTPVQPAVPLRDRGAGLAQALALRDAGRLEEAEKQLHWLFEGAPGDATLHYELGLVLQMQGKHASAKAVYGTALALDPAHADANNNLGAILKGEGAFEQALQYHQRALAARPGSIDALNNVAVAMQALGRIAESLAYFERALALQPDHAGLHYNYATALHALARLDLAIDHYRKSLQLDSGLVLAHRSLGDVLHACGRADEAELQFRRALELEPQSPESWYGLGLVQLGAALLTQAAESFGKALALRPQYAQAQIGLGMAQKELGQFADARAHYLTALQLRPGYAEAWDKLGGLHCDQGEPSEALDCYRKALQLEPIFEKAHHNLCFTLNYVADLAPQEIFEAHLAFARRHCESLRPMRHANQPDPNRRLRVGYVSGDFRNHAISYFLEPVLASHDRAQLEVVCYNNFPKSDAVTERLRAHADRWENIYQFDHAEVARRIAADRVDILCGPLRAHQVQPAVGAGAQAGAGAGHLAGLFEYHRSAGDRLPHRRLPGGTTRTAGGLSFGTTGAHAAQPVVLSAAAQLPGRFGTAGGALGTNHLRELPRFCQNQPVCSRIVEQTAGADAGRALARGCKRRASGRREFFPALCPIRHCRGKDPIAPVQIVRRLSRHAQRGRYRAGHASVRRGHHDLSRVVDGRFGGARVLAAVGLSELVAASAEDYVSIAAQLAGDLPRLADLRAGLRQRTRTSPLCDGPGFTRDLERLYRGMWMTWCAKQ